MLAPVIARVKATIARTFVNRTFGWVLRAFKVRRLRRYGCEFDVEDPAVDDEVRALLFWRLYERSELRLVKALRTDLDVVELGACIGVLSSVLAKRLDPGRQIVCVEPDPRSASLLLRHLQMNAVQTRASVLQAAVDYSGTPTVRLSGSQRCIDRHVVSDPTAAPAGLGCTALAVRLADVVAGLGAQPYVLVVDIEGMEVALIDQDLDALAGCAQVLVEFHDTHERTLILAKLMQVGFVLLQQDGSAVVLERAVPPAGTVQSEVHNARANARVLSRAPQTCP